MNPQFTSDNTDRVHIGISVFPTLPPPPSKSSTSIPDKLVSIMKKYKYNWRLDQLSKPRYQKQKYVAKPIVVVRGGTPLPPPPRLTEEIKYYSDQMSRPKLKDLYWNKQYFGEQNRKLRKGLDKNISKAWESIYNYYKKRQRNRRLRQLRMEKAKRKPFVINLQRYNELSKPKPVFRPPPKQKSLKIFSNYDHLNELAAPREYYLEPEKKEGVSPAALAYEATETILRLAQAPPRALYNLSIIIPGAVKRSALRYKVTPRIEEIAIPKKRSDKAQIDEDYNPWAISKKALRYKATPRILELAKPVDRD